MAKQRKPRQELIHALNANGEAFRQACENRSARTLCGAALFYQRRTSGGGTMTRRHTVITLNQARNLTPSKWEHRSTITTPRKGCPKCRALAVMPDDERDAAMAQALIDKRQKSEADKLKRADERTEKHAERDLRITEAQVDALVILDHYEATGQWLDRCPRVYWPGPNGSGQWRCNKRRGHACADVINWPKDLPVISDAKIHGCLPQQPNEKPHVELAATIAIAIEMQKRDAGRNDRGDKPYKLKPRYRCRLCYWEGHTPIRGVRGVTLCPTCKTSQGDWYRVVNPDQQVNQKDVCCRFCDERLEADVKLGTDLSKHPEIVQHTTVCALRYLGGVKRTQLPCQSFVLGHDDDTVTRIAEHVKCDKCGDESNSEPGLQCGRSLGLDADGEETLPPYCDGTYHEVMS